MSADGAALGRIARRARWLEREYGRPVSETLPRLSLRVRELESEYGRSITEVLLEVVWLKHRGNLQRAGRELQVPRATLNQWLVLLSLNRQELALRQALLVQAGLALLRRSAS